MSTQRGNSGKKKGQRHQNTTTFKIDKYGIAQDNLRAKQLKLPVGGVCARCKEVLEWKKKYDKYKPLSAPAKCAQCQQKTVLHAYHILCLPCATEKNVCCKCGKGAENIVPPPVTPKEQQRMEVEEALRVEEMSERQRRAYLRKKEAAPKKKSTADGAGGEPGSAGQGAADAEVVDGGSDAMSGQESDADMDGSMDEDDGADGEDGDMFDD